MKFPYKASASNYSFPALRETRESQPFNDAVIQAIITASQGTTTPDPAAIGALETAAGLYAACFAAARIEGDAPALTPCVRALLARDLIRRGESVFRLVVEGGALALRPAGSWDVRGGPAESAWYYRLDEFGPSGNMTYFVPSAGVIHARYAVDPSRPWYGLGPLQWARATGTLAAGLETRLGEEAGGAVGHLMPVPQDGGDNSDDDPLAALKADIRAGKGKPCWLKPRPRAGARANNRRRPRTGNPGASALTRRCRCRPCGRMRRWRYWPRAESPRPW